MHLQAGSQTPRNYVVPTTLVKVGKNIITVRLFNCYMVGM